MLWASANHHVLCAGPSCDGPIRPSTRHDILRPSQATILVGWQIKIPISQASRLHPLSTTSFAAENYFTAAHNFSQVADGLDHKPSQVSPMRRMSGRAAVSTKGLTTRFLEIFSRKNSMELTLLGK